MLAVAAVALSLSVAESITDLTYGETSTWRAVITVLLAAAVVYVFVRQ